MIHSEIEYSRIQHIVKFMTNALTRIAAIQPPVDGLVAARLRVYYEAHIPELQAELQAYTLRKAQYADGAQFAAAQRAEHQIAFTRWQKAQRQIEVIERSLDALQRDLDALEHERPLDHRELTAVRDDIALQRVLLHEWRLMVEELVSGEPASTAGDDS
jgi:hypothetical protein